MVHDLYFLQIIGQAINAQNPIVALKQAVSQIKTLSHRQGYKRGFQQFIAFWEELKRNLNQNHQQDLVQLNSYVISTIKPILHNSQDACLKIIVATAETIIATFPLIRSKDSYKVFNVKPGKYTFILSSGRILWEGTISVQDLVWTEAFQKTSLKMAASTEKPKLKASRKIELLNGDIVARILPGIEKGCIEIKTKVPI